jgi:V/A-type H+-transporting ATPase subunit D
VSGASGGGGPATRQNLLRVARRLERVHKGTELLRRKREALVAELFRIARPALHLRTDIGAHAATAYPALARALAQQGRSGLAPFGWPPRRLAVELRAAQTWGIAIGEVTDRPPVRRTLAARGMHPGGTGAATTEAAREFEELTELLLEAAGREALLRRLGDALARTTRQVNSLEHRVAPELGAQVTAMRRTLDEREREEHYRLQRLLRR